jgi:hypothetical protein
MARKYSAFVRLSDQAFAELKKISIEEFGDTLSDFEIRDMGSRLLNLVDLLITPEEKDSQAGES